MGSSELSEQLPVAAGYLINEFSGQKYQNNALKRAKVQTWVIILCGSVRMSDTDRDLIDIKISFF